MIEIKMDEIKELTVKKNKEVTAKIISEIEAYAGFRFHSDHLGGIREIIEDHLMKNYIETNDILFEKAGEAYFKELDTKSVPTEKPN